jgi:ankyrin repeat protein
MASSLPHRSCPCQHISLSLSSATAAEYGDIQSLSHRLHKRSNEQQQQQHSTISNGGITPLHLAAQHDHPAAVLLLLSEGGCHVDTGFSKNQTTSFCGATPLHRASFSGAISAMQVLLDWGTVDNSATQTNILAKDSSFGDLRTPLHKAVAGGRPLAVQLLLITLRQRRLLESGLNCVDSRGMTPLDLAKEFTTLEAEELECEKCSVRRWDSIAGGPADWVKCQTLLEKAMTSASINSTIPIQKDLPQNRDLNASENSSFLFCKDGADCKDGTCRTSVWEHAFRSALATSLETSLGVKASTNDHNDHNYGLQKVNADTVNKQSPSDYDQKYMPTANDADSKRFGRVCDICHEHSPALFRLNNGLICRRCRRSRRT